MKSLAIWIVLSAGVCWGQQTSSTAVTSPGVVEVGPIPPAPLKCGKYQTFEPTHMVGCGNMACSIPDRCADNLHTLTEKEWQDLQAEIKTLRTAISQQIRK